MTSICPTCGQETRHLPDEQSFAAACDVLGLTKACAIFFVILWRANGRTVTYDTFHDVLGRLMGRDDTSLPAIKKRTAKALRGKPVQIESVYGLGYRMRRLDPAWSWQTASA